MNTIEEYQSIVDSKFPSSEKVKLTITTNSGEFILFDNKAPDFSVKNIDDVDGSGNALFIEEVYQNSVLHITSLGAMAKSAGKVAADGVKAYSTFANSKAAVEARLADQLLLPMALAAERGAGESEIKTISVTNHIRTNMRLIEHAKILNSLKRNKSTILKFYLYH